MQMLLAADPSAKVVCDTVNHITCSTGLPQVNASTGALGTILQIVIGTLAALTVLIIVIAGYRFVEAQGDPQAVTKARSTMIYALIGLIVCVSAEVIVGFTLNKL